ncbi:hypothetical protein FD04_GL001352 [Secundilactobacillus odoratitofui DSM 19909 = JCM 15043]|uniref:Uncharacterized protein n=1 Tax=Secundilactobacillus odoratitofui DSM 19909 = JCM 15043 TaxID=1423776 RepID=A0A0R1LPB4_9LACO|nr:hypothetical protein FD04_GL001352 [Secundilactobacillus odoratitofui DSM 19909 = JCM 15043]
MVVTGDHLRMCGEYKLLKKIIAIILGSPPHVRRILENVLVSTTISRITSACAENTSKKIQNLIHFGDHLRMCGEYLSMLLNRSLHWGSPPHVRRIHSGKRYRDGGIGITSACAENTREVMIMRRYTLGSPPHVRRIHSGKRYRDGGIGITSACAENTGY